MDFEPSPPTSWRPEMPDEPPGGPPPSPTPRSAPRHAGEVPKELLLGRATRHLGRALLRRCPHCGSGRLFSRWVVMRRSCPGCGLVLDRNEADYFIGSYVVNFVTAELLIVTAAFATIYLTWPDVPWDGLKWGLMATIVPMPVLFYPWAKTIWLAIDLTFRPPTLGEFEGHGENLGEGVVPFRTG